MQYTVNELQVLVRVLLAETAISATAMSQQIAGHDQVVRRLLAGGNATYASATERMSDWIDANWPIQVPWPLEVEQRGRARTARLDRYDEALNEAARKMGRLEQRAQLLGTLATGFDEGAAGIARLSRVIDDQLTQFGAIVEDMRETLVRLRLTPKLGRAANDVEPGPPVEQREPATTD
jgi:hypothetical protein